MSCPYGHRRASLLVLAFILALFTFAGVRAQEEDVVTVPDSPDDPTPQAATVTNNDFETGNLNGWTTAQTSGCTGTGWNAYSGTSASSFFFSVNPPPQGSFAAMSFGNCSSLNTMYQDISLPAGQRHTLSFTIFYYSRNTSFTDPSGGSTSLGGTQGYRVDVMKTTATNDSVAASDVLANVFKTKPGDADSLSPRRVTFDLSAFAGQTVRNTKTL